MKQPVEAAPGMFLRERRVLAEQLSGRLIVHPKSEVPRCWLGRQSHQWRSQFLPREAPRQRGSPRSRMLPWQKGIPPRTLSSISTGKFSGTTYRSFLVHPFSNRRRNSCTMVASQLNLAGAREVVIPVLFLFLPDRSPERSRENRRRSALLDSPPGSGHMKQSRDRGTQKSINRMENASNRAGIVEISTLVEGKGERGKTGEVVQRWNPLAAGIWLPATVARILDASPARGHEAKPVPKDLHCTRSLQVNPGDCRNAKIKSGNGGVNPGLIVCQGSGPGPALHTAGGSGPLLGSRTLYRIRRVNLRLRG